MTFNELFKINQKVIDDLVKRDFEDYKKLYKFAKNMFDFLHQKNLFNEFNDKYYGSIKNAK